MKGDEIGYARAICEHESLSVTETGKKVFVTGRETI